MRRQETGGNRGARVVPLLVVVLVAFACRNSTATGPSNGLVSKSVGQVASSPSARLPMSIRRDIAGIALGSSAKSLLSSPGWRQMSGLERAAVGTFALGDNLIAKDSGNVHIFCSVSTGRVWVVALVVDATELSDCLSRYSAIYGEPSRPYADCYSWQDSSTILGLQVWKPHMNVMLMDKTVADIDGMLKAQSRKLKEDVGVVKEGIAVKLFTNYLTLSERDAAARLAAAVANELFGDPPGNREGAAFLDTNRSLVREKLRELVTNREIREDVSLALRVWAMNRFVGETSESDKRMDRIKKLDELGLLAPPIDSSPPDTSLLVISFQLVVEKYRLLVASDR